MPDEHLMTSLRHLRLTLERANDELERVEALTRRTPGQSTKHAVLQIAHALGVVEGLMVRYGESTSGTGGSSTQA